MKAIIGARYRHYKNAEEYVVRGFARHSETQKECVIYEGLYCSEEFGDNQVWTRDRREFEEDVTYEGKKMARFSQI